MCGSTDLQCKVSCFFYAYRALRLFGQDWLLFSISCLQLVFWRKQVCSLHGGSEQYFILYLKMFSTEIVQVGSLKSWSQSVALMEDLALRGFSPLVRSQERLSFNQKTQLTKSQQVRFAQWRN